MKHVYGLILFTLVVQQGHAAETVTTKEITATKFNIEEEVEYKPWSVNMGFSKIDTQTSSLRKAIGKGVTINLQREVIEQFEVGAAFTNYAIDFKPTDQYDATYVTRDNHTNIFDVFGEFKPIQLGFYEALAFEAAINAGVSYDTASFETLFFYGIGASIDYNRQMGLRADLKTYLSKANVNTVSLVGYF